jgi:serine/threonine protein kinase
LNRTATPTPIDRYVILEHLAEGGMGAIYLGKKLGMEGFEKEVVLKQLLPEFTEQAAFTDLFLREARLSASLDHVNIVHTIDFVQAGKDYFIVMEYVRGADLRTIAKRSRRRAQHLPVADVLFIMREILAALAYAYARPGPDGQPLRLIHRDISPSNILLSDAGEAKLTDFGIAKASSHLSVFYKVKGKVGYMAPEQARGEPVDHRSDLYSLGICLYEMLTGERLFIAEITTSAAVIYSKAVEAPSKKRPGIPPELDALALKALAMNPAQRFQSAHEFQDALARVAHRHGLMASAVELARHLREILGPDTAHWRNLDGEVDNDLSPADPNQKTGAIPSAIGVEATSVIHVPKTSLATLAGAPDEAVATPPLSPERPRAPTPQRQAAELDDGPTQLSPRVAAAEPSVVVGDAVVAALMDDAPTNATHRRRPELFDDVTAHRPAPAALLAKSRPSEPSVAAAPLQSVAAPPVPAEVKREPTPVTSPDRQKSAPQPAESDVGPPPAAAPLNEAPTAMRSERPPSPLSSFPPAPEANVAADSPMAPAPRLKPAAPSAAARRAAPAPAPAQPRSDARRPAPVADVATEMVLDAVRPPRRVTVTAVLLLGAGAGAMGALGAWAITTGVGARWTGLPRVLSQPEASAEAIPAASTDAVGEPRATPGDGFAAPRPTVPPRFDAAQQGSLEIEAQPKQAEVKLNGVVVCTSTPCRVPQLPREPVYLVELVKPGFQRWGTLVDLRFRHTEHVMARLLPEASARGTTSVDADGHPLGYLVVPSPTPGQEHEVRVNGKELGAITGWRIPLPAGVYDIVVAHPRLPSSAATRVAIVPGATVERAVGGEPEASPPR